MPIKLHIINPAVSSALAVLVSSLAITSHAGSVTYADPMPAGPSYPSCLPDSNGTPAGNDGGISYDWIVKLGNNDSASFVNHVGAKSYNEPPPYASPETGWTHTSNWVALELTERTKVRIMVERQEGVPFTVNSNVLTARNKLVPALSLYSGWDNTSCEDHRYNPKGDVEWTTVKYMASKPNARAKSQVELEADLDAGKYSIAIGGTPKVLPVYPDAASCNPVADPVCYAYTGRHGYRVIIKTERNH